jgi:beta-glucanase (GH16 family)
MAGKGYTMYQDLNAFEPFGCTDITTNDDTTWGSEEECLALCSADDGCECATYERETGGCWKRCNCVLEQMNSGYNAGFNVYMKDAGSSGACRASTQSTTEHVDGSEYVPVKEYIDELEWFDNFDGSVLDESKWDIREGDVRVNDELQAYRRGGDNLVMTGQSMKIRALCEEYKGQSFTSVKLHSKVMWKAGHRVEAKIRMSTGPGTWPAFWLMGSGADEWPAVGELDILEYTGCANEVMGNLHFRNRHGDNPVNTYKTTVDASVWHTYRVDWVADGMTFYIDDAVVGHVASKGSYSAWPYNTNEFFIIINLAIGGTLGGPCLNGGVQPSCDEWMEVDWVRVSILK